MKVLKREYCKRKDCQDFWSWFWFTRDYPHGTTYENWFRLCGSPLRQLICRRFGFTTIYVYDRRETFLNVILCIIASVLFCFLMLEIFLIVLINK